jgi:hypothetical protein
LFFVTQSIRKGGFIMGSRVVNFRVVLFKPAPVIGKAVSVNVDVGLDNLPNQGMSKPACCYTILQGVNHVAG